MPVPMLVRGRSGYTLLVRRRGPGSVRLTGLLGFSLGLACGGG
jgi:hypothetical protein